MTEPTRTDTLAPLRADEVLALAQLVTAARSGALTVRLIDADTGTLARGTARSIGDQNGNFARAGDDIRALWLRVTLDAGFDAFWPVAELVTDLGTGSLIFVGPADRR